MLRLAADGGKPVREEKLFYGKQWIEEDDITAVTKILRSDFITCGPAVTQLEQEFARYVSAAYAVAVSSGTAALHCACIAAGIGPGDEVITTPLTFAASASCILYCGAKPVFADIDAETYNIDPVSIEAPHEGSWYYEQISLGYNYRMTDFQAALLLSQLKKLKRFKKRRQKITELYDQAFQDLAEIIIQKEIAESDTCRHLYVIRLDLNRLACTRRQFFDAMSAENIQCQVHYVPVYWFPYYKHMGYKKGLCPNAEKIYQGILSIPLYPKMTDQDVKDVIQAVKKIVENYRIR